MLARCHSCDRPSPRFLHGIINISVVFHDLDHAVSPHMNLPLTAIDATEKASTQSTHRLIVGGSHQEMPSNFEVAGAARILAVEHLFGVGQLRLSSFDIQRSQRQSCCHRRHTRKAALTMNEWRFS